MAKLMVTTTIRLEPDLLEQIQDAAYQDRQSGNAWILAAVRAALARRAPAEGGRS